MNPNRAFKKKKDKPTKTDNHWDKVPINLSFGRDGNLTITCRVCGQIRTEYLKAKHLINLKMIHCNNCTGNDWSWHMEM